MSYALKYFNIMQHFCIWLHLINKNKYYEKINLYNFRGIAGSCGKI